MRLAAMAAGLFALALAGRLEARSARSLTDSEQEPLVLAQGVTITVPTEPSRERTNSGEQEEKILLLRSSVQSLTESLAAARNEAEAFKRQASDLALKLEALGIPAVEKNQSKLEQRLLAAVRELRASKKQNEDATNQLLRLVESVQILLKSASQVDPEAQTAVEAEVRKTNELLGNAGGQKGRPVEATLNDGMIVDVKEDLSLVIANIGVKQGVEVGMPFQVWRESKRIGFVRVVDVRDRISGAVVQSLESEKIPVKKGDRLKVDAKK